MHTNPIDFASLIKKYSRSTSKHTFPLPENCWIIRLISEVWWQLLFLIILFSFFFDISLIFCCNINGFRFYAIYILSKLPKEFQSYPSFYCILYWYLVGRNSYWNYIWYINIMSLFSVISGHLNLSLTFIIKKSYRPGFSAFLSAVYIPAFTYKG